MNTAQYKTFMESYVQFMEELAGSETEKYASLVSYDLKRMDRAVSNQQAMNMRLNKMEEQRLEEQKKAGLEGLTFRQILDRLDDPAEKEEFTTLFRRFESAVNEVKFYNGKSMAFAKDGLSMLGISEKEAQAAPYSSDGKRSEGSNASIFEAKV